MAKTKKKSLSKPGRGPGRPTKEETLRNGMKWKTGKAGKSGPNLGKWKIFVHRVLKQVHPDVIENEAIFRVSQLIVSRD